MENPFEREEEGEGSTRKELLIDQTSREKNRKENKETIAVGGIANLKEVERPKEKDIRLLIGGSCSFIKGINTMCLHTKQLWWFKTLLPEGCMLPPSIGSHPAQLPPAEQSRENSNGHPSPLWPLSSLSLIAHNDKLKLSCLTSH